MNPEDFYTDPEGLAESTDRSKMPREFLEIRDTFVNLFEPRDRILDVGCGPGHDIRYFEQNNLDAIGIDISPDMVAYVNSRGFDAVKADMKDMEFADNSFDGIWCCASIHFHPPEKMKDAVKELYRVASKGGIAQITFKLGEGSYVQETSDGSIEHYLVLEDEALEIVDNAGFEIDRELTVKNDPGREEFDYFLNVFAKKPEE